MSKGKLGTNLLASIYNSLIYLKWFLIKERKFTKFVLSLHKIILDGSFAKCFA